MLRLNKRDFSTIEEIPASKMLKMMEMSGTDYAYSQSWDIIDACNALIQMASLARNEINEPDISKVSKIMKQITDFIAGEIKQLEQASLEMQNIEVLEDYKSINDKYVKSLGVELSPKDLAVKYIAKNEIKGYTFLWGSPDKTDIEIEYFTKSTDFWDDKLSSMKSRPLTWDHAQDKSFKGSPVIGDIVEFGDDEIGRWFVAKLEQSHRYKQAVDELIKRGVLGASSDSAPQYTLREQTGKSTWIKQWPWFASALTNVPAEPRTIDSLEFLKSLGVVLPDVPVIRERYNYKKRQLQLLQLKK